MASNDIEVLDPATTVEKHKETESGVALDRRHFLTALGVAGAAASVMAGADLLSPGPHCIRANTAPDRRLQAARCHEFPDEHQVREGDSVCLPDHGRRHSKLSHVGHRRHRPDLQPATEDNLPDPADHRSVQRDVLR